MAEVITKNYYIDLYVNWTTDNPRINPKFLIIKDVSLIWADGEASVVPKTEDDIFKDVADTRPVPIEKDGKNNWGTLLSEENKNKSYAIELTRAYAPETATEDDYTTAISSLSSGKSVYWEELQYKGDFVYGNLVARTLYKDTVDSTNPDSQSYKINGGTDTTIDDDLVNYVFTKQVPIRIGAFKVPITYKDGDTSYQAELGNCSLLYTIVPAMACGKLSEYAITNVVNFSEIILPVFEMSEWRYYKAGNNMNLTFNIKAIPETGKEIEKISIEFWDCFGKQSVYELKDRETYNGSITEILPLDGTGSNFRLLKPTADSVHPGGSLLTQTEFNELSTDLKKNTVYVSNLYSNGEQTGLTKFEPKLNKESEFTAYSVFEYNDAGQLRSNHLYRCKIQAHLDDNTPMPLGDKWLWTNSMFNDYYYSTLDFDTLEGTLALDVTAQYKSNANWQYNIETEDEHKSNDIAYLSYQLQITGDRNIDITAQVDLAAQTDTFKLNTASQLSLQCYECDQSSSVELGQEVCTKELYKVYTLSGGAKSNLALKLLAQSFTDGKFDNNYSITGELNDLQTPAPITYIKEDDTTKNGSYQSNSKNIGNDGKATFKYTFNAKTRTVVAAKKGTEEFSGKVIEPILSSAADLDKLGLSWSNNKLEFNNYLRLACRADTGNKNTEWFWSFSDSPFETGQFYHIRGGYYTKPLNFIGFLQVGHVFLDPNSKTIKDYGYFDLLNTRSGFIWVIMTNGLKSLYTGGNPMCTPPDKINDALNLLPKDDYTIYDKDYFTDRKEGSTHAISFKEDSLLPSSSPQNALYESVSDGQSYTAFLGLITSKGIIGIDGTLCVGDYSTGKFTWDNLDIRWPEGNNNYWNANLIIQTLLGSFYVLKDKNASVSINVTLGSTYLKDTVWSFSLDLCYQTSSDLDLTNKDNLKYLRISPQININYKYYLESLNKHLNTNNIYPALKIALLNKNIPLKIQLKSIEPDLSREGSLESYNYIYRTASNSDYKGYTGSILPNTLYTLLSFGSESTFMPTTSTITLNGISSCNYSSTTGVVTYNSNTTLFNISANYLLYTNGTLSIDKSRVIMPTGLDGNTVLYLGGLFTVCDNNNSHINNLGAQRTESKFVVMQALVPIARKI